MDGGDWADVVVFMVFGGREFSGFGGGALPPKRHIPGVRFTIGSLHSGYQSASNESDRVHHRIPLTAAVILQRPLIPSLVAHHALVLALGDFHGAPNRAGLIHISEGWLVDFHSGDKIRIAYGLASGDLRIAYFSFRVILRS